MFGNTKKPQIATPSTLNGKPETVIGTNTSIVGSLKSDGNIRIDGSVEGDIEILGNLIIGETGRVIATRGWLRMASILASMIFFSSA